MHLSNELKLRFISDQIEYGTINEQEVLEALQILIHEILDKPEGEQNINKAICKCRDALAEIEGKVTPASCASHEWQTLEFDRKRCNMCGLETWK